MLAAAPHIWIPRPRLWAPELRPLRWLDALFMAGKGRCSSGRGVGRCTSGRGMAGCATIDACGCSTSSVPPNSFDVEVSGVVFCEFSGWVTAGGGSSFTAYYASGSVDGVYTLTKSGCAWAWEGPVPGGPIVFTLSPGPGEWHITRIGVSFSPRGSTLTTFAGANVSATQYYDQTTATYYTPANYNRGWKIFEGSVNRGASITNCNDSISVPNGLTVDTCPAIFKDQTAYGGTVSRV